MILNTDPKMTALFLGTNNRHCKNRLASSGGNSWKMVRSLMYMKVKKVHLDSHEFVVNQQQVCVKPDKR